MPKKAILFIAGLALLVSMFMYFRNDPMSVSHAPGISDAIATKEVLLNNGQTVELTAGYVMQLVGDKKIKMLAYNGMIPGPTLRVPEGAEITVKFVNNTDMPTLLHSHGVRMENQYDGSQLVQSDIKPGESFSYKLRFTDPGVFWYHPHVREDIQQNMGLYGNFIVMPKDGNYWPPTDHEETLFLSDVYMEDGTIAPYSNKYVTHALMGRFGNTILVNGDTAFAGMGEPGEVHRMYVTNAATVRPFNFRVGGGAKMKLIGADNGRYEKETFVESVIVAPSERAVIDVYFPTAGKYQLEHAVPGGTIYALGEITISGESVESAGKTFATLRVNQKESEEFAGLRRYLKSPPEKHLRLTLTMDMAKIMSYYMGGASSVGGHDHSASGMAGMDMGSMDMSGMDTDMNEMPMMGVTDSVAGTPAHGMMMTTMHPPVPIEWEDTMGDMNTFSTSETVKWIMRDEDTGKENMDVVWKFTQGSPVKIRITNDPTSGHPMQHPIHFHGNRFAILTTNDVPNDNMVWKDTTMLKTGDVLDIILETTNPGKWMGHCHIAEHMHSGMMMEYDVE